MKLGELVVETGSRWGLDPRDWSVLVDGAAPVVRLPAADAVLHVARREVGADRTSGLHRARSALGEHDIPVVDLVPSLTGRSWHRIAGRIVEVERWVPHDGRMNRWSTLRAGCALLARVHDAWADLDLGPTAEACSWANWISPTDVVHRCRTAAARLRRWGLTRLGDDVVCLAEATGLDPDLPTQLVHGDFWDDNVYLRGDAIAAVTDFDFVGRRPRIDDLTLLLFFADEQPFFDGSGPRDARTRQTDLTPLVRAYAARLRTPLSAAELAALPTSLARQALWTYGVWIATDPDEDHARQEAIDCAPAVARALEITADPDRWHDAFARAADR